MGSESNGLANSELMADEGLSVDELRDYVFSNLDDFDLDLLIQVTENSDEPLSIVPTDIFEDENLNQIMDDLLEEVELEDLEKLL